VEVAGRGRFDPAVTEAQIRALSVVEHSADGAAKDIRGAWSNVSAALNHQDAVAVGR